MKPKLRGIALSIIPVLGSMLVTPSIAANTDTLRQPAANTPGNARSIPAEARPQAGDMRVSRILGMEVQDAAGRRLGKVEDLWVDTKDARVAFAVLQADDAPAIGDQRITLPIDKVRGSRDGDRILLDMSAAELASLGTQEPRTAAGDSVYRLASELLQADLEDREGRDVGDVKDIVVNLGSGRIGYGVAEFDTSWFAAGKLVVVPVENIRARAGSRDLMLAVDRERMRAAPAFDRDRWPDVNEPGFRAQLAEYADKAAGFAQRVEDKITR